MPAPVKTYLRAFAAVVLALFLADGADVFAVDATDLRAWLAAGLASCIAVALKALDSTEPEYGRGAE